MIYCIYSLIYNNLLQYHRGHVRFCFLTKSLRPASQSNTLNEFGRLYKLDILFIRQHNSINEFGRLSKLIISL